MKRTSNWSLVFGATLLTGFLFLAGFVVRQRVEVGKWILVAKNETKGERTFPNASRTVDTDTIVDESEADYFYTIAELLKHEYVEPIQIDSKMAEGSVKGMVNSLVDSKSRYYGPDDYEAYLQTDSGTVKGSGLDLAMTFDAETLAKFRQKKEVDGLSLLPDLMVVDVVPQSSADLVGLKPGDEILQVNSKFIIAGSEIRKLRQLQKDFEKDPSLSGKLHELETQIQDKAKTSMTALRARNILGEAVTAPVKVAWRRGEQEMSAVLQPKEVDLKPVLDSPDGMTLDFVAGSVAALKQHALKDGQTIDLRHSGEGDFAEMFGALDLIAPRGKIGWSQNEHGKTEIDNTLDPAFPVHGLHLLVDDTTRGAASVFANALVGLGIADMKGKPSNDDDIVEFVPVDSSSGFTLVTGHFVPVTAGAVAR